MKKILILTFLISFSFLRAQEIFDYEKKIDINENYTFQEIEFENSAEKLKLFGTLISPKKAFEKVIIIVPGSGIDSQHAHFILTEELLKNNIAVFRYDERGVGKSEGDNTYFRYGISQITADLLFAIKTLKNNELLKDKKLGLIGHSQGGMATIGALQKNAEVDFLIQWATPTQKHGEFFKYQIQTGVNTFDNQLKYDTNEKKIEIIRIVQQVVEKNLTDDDLTLSKKLNKATKKQGYKRKNYDRFQFWTFPSMKDLLRQNYETTYKNVNIPLLYIIGSKDIFVDPITNSELLKSYKNPLIDISVIEGLNHYLTKESIDPSNLAMKSSLYEMDKKALNRIIEWINNN